MMGLLLYFLGILFIIFFFNKIVLMSLVQNLMFSFFFLYIFYLLNMKWYNFWVFIYMDYGMDKISMMLVFLTLWIFPLMIMSVLNLLNLYLLLLLLFKITLMISLILFFFSLDLINFYLFFELSLIPIYFMILGWGVQPERLEAGIYMIIYTLFASLPFFIILIYLYFNFLTMNFMLNSFNFLLFGELNSFYMHFLLIFIFLVKLPSFMMHLWLPKAHVEAPIFGSMVLAGIMLKLGGYGFIRISFIFIELMELNKMFWVIYLLYGSWIMSLICMILIDLKMLIAYSSIVHMGLMICSLMMNFELSLKSGLGLMIGHGLCSSGLFCLLNFQYKRIGSRNLYLNKGMKLIYKNMSLMWFLFCVINMSAPPSLNLISEIFLINNLLKYSYIMILLIFLISFFSSFYSIFLYTYTQHGDYLNNFMFSYKFNCYLNSVDEYILMILHLFPLNLFIINLLLI